MIPALAAAAVLGLIVGSFLTVVVHRTATAEPMLFGRSRCPRCARTLTWRELLPVFSFLRQRGRCRTCRGPIPIAYPAIELATAGLFILVAWRTASGAIAAPPFAPAAADWGAGALGLVTFLYASLFAAAAVAVSAYDFRYRLIPQRFVAPLAIAGGAAQVAGAFGAGSPAPLIASAAAAAGAFLAFLALWYFSAGRAMGRGDADVAGVIVLALGPAAGLVGLLFAFWIGAASGILLVATGKSGWKSQIPFAPFLFAGAVASLLVPVAPIAVLAAYAR